MRNRFYIIPILLLSLIPLWGYGLQSVTFSENNGRLGFTIYATMHNPEAEIHKFEGYAAWDEKKGFSSSTGWMVVPVSSIDTRNSARDDTLRNYCLEEKQYPRIHFEVDRIEKIPAALQKNTPYEADLIGKLTIKDVTKPVKIPVHAILGDKDLSIQGGYILNWLDYHVKDPSNLILKVNKNVRITWELSIPMVKK